MNLEEIQLGSELKSTNRFVFVNLIFLIKKGIFATLKFFHYKEMWFMIFIHILLLAINEQCLKSAQDEFLYAVYV